MTEQWPSMLSPTVTKQLKCKYVTAKSFLGDGNFSIVKQCMNIHTKEFYAMKLIHKKLIKDKLQLIKREFKLLNNISSQIRDIEENNGNTYCNNTANNESTIDTFVGHHHILQLFDFFETVDHIVLITQLCENDDLYEKIISHQHLDLQRQVMPYTACIISSLIFLHEQGIVHRDIKAENILFRLKKNNNSKRKGSNNPEIESNPESSYDLTSHDLILADFGLAIDTKDATKSSLKEYVGTISYIAPEIVSCKGINNMGLDQLDKLEPYDTKIDIWALGVLVYFMALGYTPFDCETDDETLDCISKCDYYIDNDSVLDPKFNDFWNFIQCCFIVDPKKRKSAKDLTTHPLIKKYFNIPIEDSTSSDSKKNILVNEAAMVKPDLTRRNKSFCALSSLRKPPLRKASQSFLTKISSNPPADVFASSNYFGNSSSSSNNMIQTPLTTASPSPIIESKSRIDNSTINMGYKVKNMQNNSTNNNNNSSSSSSTIHTNGNSGTNLLPPPIQSINIRDSLRKTLSMTNIKHITSSTNATVNTSTNSFQSIGSSSFRINKLSSGKTNSGASSATTGRSTTMINTHSTFFLDPQPPKTSLMNGEFSEMPETRSNFNTTPHSSLSRNSSIGNDVNAISRVSSIGNQIATALNNTLHTNANTNGANFSRNSSFKNLKMTYFDLDYESDSSLL